MAFNPSNLVRWSPVYPPAPATLPIPITPVPGLPQQWAYNAGADTLADVAANGYFYYFADWLNEATYNDGNFIGIGDSIYCVCSDGTNIFAVTTLAPNIQTEVLVAITPGSITTADLANLAVTTAKLANLAVTAAKIANATITTTQISAAAGILGTQLANNTIAAAQITNGTITTTQISNTAGITGTQLAAGTVVAANIANGTITTTQISNTAGITGTQLAAATVAAANIVAGTITTTQISNTAGIVGGQLANNTVTSAKLDPTTIKYVEIPMTAANWNGMYAAPFILIAAQGANTLIKIKDVAIEVNYGGAQFAVGGAVALQYNNTNHGGGVLATNTIPGATVDAWAADATVGLDGVITDSDAVDTVNQGIYISNDTAAFTTGTSAFVLHIWYAVVPTTF